MKRFIIIPAAGIGQRFGNAVPKQFAELNGKPVLMHTLERFAFTNEKIILVLNPSYIRYWQNLCDKLSFKVPHTIVEGGKTRTDSVKNGLTIIKDDGIVAIHDAVRPLVSRTLIEKIFAEAEKTGNAIPAIEMQHSLRKIEAEKNFAVDRKEYKIIQTPQCFDVRKLKAAYENLSAGEFTDDASVYESSGEKINLVEGEFTNIKITEAHDLLVAEALIRTLQ
ncbi:MAG TPA: 2-C-methyl-D-erythritol 4-phosphate cytidylyltransferase [Bacteroidia bacterium]|nr:2-C-methyl-D-erythritol 4-phosphate cytidylyltransferase [Bacteroidia bacterium]